MKVKSSWNRLRICQIRIFPNNWKNGFHFVLAEFIKFVIVRGISSSSLENTSGSKGFLKGYFSSFDPYSVWVLQNFFQAFLRNVGFVITDRSLLPTHFSYHLLFLKEIWRLWCQYSEEWIRALLHEFLIRPIHSFVTLPKFHSYSIT